MCLRAYEMKKIVFILCLLFSNFAFADTLWDLDTVVSQSKSYSGLTAKTTNGRQIILTAEYINKLDSIRREISHQAHIYPKFIISSSDVVNAGATFQNGQPVTLYTLGMLEKIGYDYDALAAVISHEVAHLTLNHMGSQQTSNAVVDILAGLAMLAIDYSYGGSARNPYKGLYEKGLELTSNLTKSGFSRSDEVEADVTGVKYMMAAGYSADGAIRLQNLIPASSSFFSTHPSSDTRIENIRTAMLNNPQYRKAPSNDTNIIVAYSEKSNQNTTNTYTEKRNLDNYARTCEDIGFKPDTTLFINCLNKFSKGKTFETNSNTATQVSYTSAEDYNKTCEDIGFKPKTKKFKECILRFKGENSTDSSNTADMVDSEDKNMGQIGTVIAIKKKDKSVVFSSKIEEEIAKGSTVKILADKKYITATITNYFDGYYSANVDNVAGISKGNSVVISN
jgi:Zn-dependent protease with chaperone function/predicted HicB family RNase H-like nuclease